MVFSGPGIPPENLFNLIKSLMLQTPHCKSTCLYNAPSLHTLEPPSSFLVLFFLLINDTQGASLVDFIFSLSCPRIFVASGGQEILSSVGFP